MNARLEEAAALLREMEEQVRRATIADRAPGVIVVHQSRAARTAADLQLAKACYQHALVGLEQTALENSEQWQPIETAPPGDDPVLVWSDRWSFGVDIGWRIGSDWVSLRSDRTTCWPTHWAPLLRPPPGDV